MIKVALLASLAVALAARVPVVDPATVQGRVALDDELIAKINSARSTWTAGRNEYFEGKTLDDAVMLLGWKPKAGVKLDAAPSYRVEAPASFDSRQQWPGLIGPVLDQGRCGSCWAFGATESISDRTSIANGTTFVQLAPLDLTTCDENDDGCEGGDASTAWMYAKRNGLVTEACYPYLQSQGGPIATCAPTKEPCPPSTFVSTPSCTQSCQGELVWSKDLYYVKSVYGVNGAAQMATELSTNGPFEVCFSVYEDFLTYQSGVYQHTHGAYLGGHCTKVIGYGTSGSTPYWLVQNSWTTTWGAQGLFMILRGSNECGIENGAVAGLV
jgi:cathepsin B